MFDFFDMHCDTATEIFNNKAELLTNNLNISLDKSDEIAKYVQTFAFWTKNDEDVTVNRFNAFTECYSYFMKQCIKNSERVMIISDKDDLKKSTDNNKRGIILAIEGGGVIEGKIERLEKLRKNGIKLLTVTWNLKNELSGGILDEVESGITETGKEAVSEMERLGIIPDVSHISDKGFEDMCAIAKKPFVATHSNSRSECRHKRNLTDDMFKEIVKRGGIVGINLYAKFLNDSEIAEDKDIVRHIDRFLKLGGEDTVVFGTDFDGVDNKLPKGIKTLKDVNKLVTLLMENYGKETAEKILYKNAYSFFEKQL